MAVCAQPQDLVILPDSSKLFVACPGSNQVASIDLKTDRVLALLEVGKLPVQMALKPDGGEIFVSNFEANSFSIVEAYTNEVSGSYLIGSNPVRGLVTSDNSLLYVSNFGSDNVSVYAIDEGRVIDSVPVGSRPDGLALTPNEEHLLVVGYEVGRCRGRADDQDARQLEDQRRARAGYCHSGRQSAERHRDQGVQEQCENSPYEAVGVNEYSSS